jgi:hypothetical protein
LFIESICFYFTIYFSQTNSPSAFFYLAYFFNNGFGLQPGL